MHDKEQKAISNIVRLCEKHPDFASELRSRLTVPGPEVPTTMDPTPDKRLLEIRDGVNGIGDVLKVQYGEEPSISYDFVKDKGTRDQLVIDNIRMENVVSSTLLQEKDRFMLFCTNAFYQVENLVNYFFQRKCSSVEDFLSFLVEKTKDCSIYFKRDKDPKKTYSIRSVDACHKISAFYKLVYPNENPYNYASHGYDTHKLRDIRNMVSHRFVPLSNYDFIEKSKRQEKNDEFIAKFIDEKTFEAVREILMQFVSLVEQQLEDGKQLLGEEVQTTPNVQVTSKYEGSCFIQYGEKKPEMLPDEFFARVKGCKVGDKLRLTVKGGKITHVEKVN